MDNKRGKLDVGVLRRLRYYIRDFRADVVHGFLFDGNVYSRVAAAGTGIPVLNSERSDNYVLRRSQIWPHRLTRHLANGVVANTWKGRDFAQCLFGLPDSRVHVVINGIRLEEVNRRVAVNTDNYRRLFFGRDDVYVACLVGTVVYAKDYLLALEVAHRLTRQDARWRVLFIGASLQGTTGYARAEVAESQRYRDQVRARFNVLELEHRAQFAGQREDALEIIAKCDVLFSTSKHEGFPNVVLEAMAVGTPVVTVEYSDIRRILPVPWQIVDRDPDQLANTILQAANQRELLAREQSHWVREHATIERSAEALEAVYCQYVRPSP